MKIDKERANKIAEKLQEGDNASKEEFIELYKKQIHGLAFRFTGDIDESRDLSQEIFIRALQKLNLFKPGTDFDSWFTRLAINHSLNYKQKLLRNPVSLAEEIDEHQHRISGDSKRLESPAEIESMISFYIQKLPKRERLALILQVIEDKKVKEIAGIMDTSVKSVESLLTRGRKRLKKLFSENEGFYIF